MKTVLEVRQTNTRRTQSSPDARGTSLRSSSPRQQFSKATLGASANMQSMARSQSGFFSSSAQYVKQPVLKIGLKSSVSSQAGEERAKFSQRPKKANVLW